MKFRHAHNPMPPLDGVKIKSLTDKPLTSNGKDTWYFQGGGLYVVPKNLADFMFSGGYAEGSFL